MSDATCRLCDGHALSLVLDFGLMPPSRRFLTPELACLPEPIHPLRLMRCDTCGLLELEGAVAEPFAAMRALEKSPTAELEIPDLLALHDRLECDLSCHETPCYPSLAQADALLRKQGLEFVDVAGQQGMLRLTVQRRGGPRRPTPAVEIARARERAAELNRPGAWADF